MKKFYFALMALLVSFCASAVDYYLIGGFNGWSLKQANCKFTAQGDGTYVLDFNGTLTSGFKINDGTWGNDAANFGGSGNLVIGQPYNLTVGGSSGNISMAGNIDNPHIVFNPTAKTLLITGQEVEASFKYGLWGAFTSSTWSAGDMTEKDGKWVIENLEVTYASAAFGIKKMDASTGSQVDWISADGASAITAAGTFNCKVEGTNWTIAKGTWNMTFDPEAMTLTVTGEGGGGDDPIPPTPTDYTGWYLNVQGDFNSWQPVGVAFNADGTVEATDLAIGTSEFELKIWNGTADSYWGNASATIVAGEPVQVYENGGHMTISGAAADGVYNVAYNAVTNMMTVTKVGGGDDPIVDTAVYALHGQITGNAAWETIAMTKNEETGNWEYTGKIVAGEFGMYKNGAWMTGGGVTVTEENYAYSFTGSGNSKNELEGQYTIVYDPAEKTITFVPYQGVIEDVITYALRGNIVTGEWADYAMDEEDGVWTVTLTVVPGEFGIKRMNNGAQEGWFAAKGETAMDAVGSYEASGVSSANWVSTLEGEYKFTFDPETEILKVDQGSGIEAVEAAEAVEAVYYNLQGVRVANPANGLYIRVAGQKASKVYVK
ncbi:MAG: hypothetical protein K2M06_05920 [Muribaculaceae bacterium]|nr:hypothetical protein [Muribaculaceae bacterium]